MILTGDPLESALAPLPYGVADAVIVAYELHLPTGVLDEGTPHQILYHQCSGGHIVIHIGHEDPATGTSVYDGSVETSISCPTSSDASGNAAGKGSPQPLSGERRASAQAVLPDGLTGHSTVVLLHMASGDEFPLGAVWSVSVCENHHVVTYIGHEDTSTMTSVFDGKVSTSISC